MTNVRRILIDYRGSRDGRYGFRLLQDSHMGGGFFPGMGRNRDLGVAIMAGETYEPDDEEPGLDLRHAGMSYMFRKLAGLTLEDLKGNQAALDILPKEGDKLNLSCYCFRREEDEGEGDDGNIIHPPFTHDDHTIGSCMVLDGWNHVDGDDEEELQLRLYSGSDYGAGLEIHDHMLQLYLQGDRVHRGNLPAHHLYKVRKHNLKAFVAMVWIYDQIYNENRLEAQDVFVKGMPEHLRGFRVW